MARLIISLLLASAAALDEQRLRGARSSDLEHRSGGRHASFGINPNYDPPVVEPFCTLLEGTMDQATCKSECTKLGMMLPCLKSTEDDEKLYDEYGDKVLSVWIGMVRDGTETQSPFKWEDPDTCDSDLNEYSNWLPKQPNNYNGNQHCVGHIYEAGTTNFAGWGDWPCNDKTKTHCCCQPKPDSA